MSTNQNAEIVRRWMATWGSGDYSMIDEYYSENYLLHTAPSHIRGRDGMKGFMSALLVAFPDMRGTVEDVVAIDDKVAWRFTIRGTHLGPFFGTPPSGARIEVPGIVISRFENGIWTEDWAQWNLFGLLTTIGALPVEAAVPA